MLNSVCLHFFPNSEFVRDFLKIYETDIVGLDNTISFRGAGSFPNSPERDERIQENPRCMFRSISSPLVDQRGGVELMHISNNTGCLY